MTAETPVTVRVVRRFDASPERVFDAWLDRETAGKFLFATRTGRMVRVEIDARIGGKFAFVDRRDGEDVEHIGEYLEIDRPRRLVFTFAVPKFSRQSTRVSIDIVPDGAGCALTLTHVGVLPDYANRTEQGWGKILDALAAGLDRGAAHGVVVEPGTIRFERLLPGPIERVWAYLTQSDKRATWLAAGEMEPRTGETVELRFLHASLSRQTVPTPERFKKYAAGHVSRHRVTAFDPPRLLSFTWADCSPAGGSSEVTFALTPQGDEVRLVLTHRRLAGRAAMVDTAGGWHTHLAILVERLSDREPRPFWSLHAEIDGVYEERFQRT